MKKIHITESQLEELKRTLNEINLNGDDALSNSNGDATKAAKDTLQNAKRDGVAVDNAATSISFSHDALKNNGISESCTKRGIKKAKLKHLRENSLVFKKSDIS